jgi:PleD family two-component response regulator
VAEHLTVSVGAASAVPSSGTESANLIAAADAALYDAKRHGRDRSALKELKPTAVSGEGPLTEPR